MNPNQVSKPAIVRTAVKLLYFALGITVFNNIIGASTDAQMSSPSFNMFVTFFSLGTEWFFIHMIKKGYNWARIFYLVLYTIFFLFFFLGILLIGTPVAIHIFFDIPISGFLFIWQTLLQIIAIVFLFRKSSSIWFYEMKAQNKSFLSKIFEKYNMAIFNRKNTITSEQLAEAMVLIPHSPNEMNKVSLDYLKSAFESDGHKTFSVIEVEYTAFCFSLWWFRCMSYLKTKDEVKVASFNIMVVEILNSYFQKTYPPYYVDTISKIYEARIESYENAYNSENYLENMADLLLWYIDFGLFKKDFCLSSVGVPVTKPLSFHIPRKIACVAVITDIRRFIDNYMKRWKVVLN